MVFSRAGRGDLRAAAKQLLDLAQERRRAAGA
jgi:hypothetical protein